MSQSIIGALRVTLGLDSAQFTRGTRQAESSIQRMGRQLRNVGLAASAMGTGLALAVRGQLNAADDAIKAAQMVGMSVEQYTRLGHAADLSGVSLEQFQTAATRMSRAMVNTPDVFRDLGIAIRDADGQMRSTDAVLLDVADVLSRMPDGAEKTALAMELLGRSGTAMIPMLNGGSDALQSMMDEADQLGLTISTETARAAEQFNDNITRLMGVGRGFAIMLAAELAPVLARISDLVVAAASSFNQLSPEVRTIAAVLGTAFVAGGPILVGLGLMAMSISALASPFALAVAGAAALAAIAATVYANWDEITAWFSELLTNVTTAISNAGIAMRDGINAWADDLRASMVALWDVIWAEVSSWPAKMMEAGGNLMRGLLDGILGGKEQAEAAAANMANSLTDIVNGEFGIQSPSRVFRTIGEFLTQGLALGIQSGAPQAVEAMNGLTDQVTDAASKSDQALANFSNGFASMLGPIVRGTQTLGDAFLSMGSRISSGLINSGLRGLGGWLGSALGLGNLFGGGKVPSFSGGGWTGNAPRTGGLDGQGGFLAMMHPQELVTDTTRNGGGPMAITVNVHGANGDAHVVRLVEQGVSEGLRQYDRALPDRMQMIQSDPRARA